MMRICSSGRNRFACPAGGAPTSRFVPRFGGHLARGPSIQILHGPAGGRPGPGSARAGAADLARDV